VDLRQPLWLLLLPIALWLALRALQGSVIVTSAGRRKVAAAARFVLLLAVILAIAGARAVLPRDELHTVFCVDRSASVDPSKQQLALDWVRDAARAMTSSDRGALVVFGEDAQVERALAASLEVPREPLSPIRREATDLGRAIRLALALLPEEVEKQVVLVSDGAENSGDALREARVAAANGVRVTTVHVPATAEPGEVLVERVDAPQYVEKGEPYTVRATIVATSPTRARVAFTRNGKIVRQEDLDLAKGANSVTLAERIDAADAFTYDVLVTASSDRNPANNQGTALVRVLGEPRALIVLREAEHGKPLAQALERAGMKVERAGAAGMPLGRDELARFDLLVVGDVAADRFSPAQLTSVRDYVRDMGGGLLALGGEQSFGLGGYYGTPFEEALPVDSDIRKKKVLPALAQVFVIDKSGSMSEQTADGATKIVLAREGVVRTVELLAREDMAGVIGFDQTPTWVAPLARLVDKNEVAKNVRTLEPGGGTAIHPALLEAVKALEKVEAQVKHVIVLTDGVSEPGDFAALLQRADRGKITVSTIGVGESGGELDEDFLRWVAEKGGGEYHHAKHASDIPPLIAKDTLTASHALLIEKPFAPVALASSDLDWRPPSPDLQGFVLTEAKDEAEVLLGSARDMTPADEGPILARWRFGIGKSAAFTSDAATRWSQAWLRWEGYTALFGSLARWLERDPRPAGLATTLELESGQGVVTVEADERRPLELEARVSAPEGSPPVPALRLEPVAPGRYRATFRATRPGVYFVGIEEIGARGARAGRGSAGAALAYPREYRELESNPLLLERIAKLTGGHALSLEDRPAVVWAHEQKPARAPRGLLPWLVALAAFLLVFEVAARRLSLPERRRAPAPALAAPDDALLERLLAKKAEEKRSSDRLPGKPVLPVATAPPPPAAPVVSPPKASRAPEPEPEPEPGADDFTAQLLRAKKRAKKDGH
jgi:uncharacterized membrane protein/Mg-chelatase subunit ChlD